MGANVRLATRHGRAVMPREAPRCGRLDQRSPEVYEESGQKVLQAFRAMNQGPNEVTGPPNASSANSWPCVPEAYNVFRAE
jgi:hypothetical protein